MAAPKTWLAIVLLGVASCRFNPELVIGEQPDADELDGGADAGDGPTPDAPGCGDWPLPPTDVNPCTTGDPAGPLTLTGGLHTIDTETGEMVLPGGAAVKLPGLIAGGVRYVAVTDLTVEGSAEVVVMGVNALVVVVHGRAVVDGILDVSAWEESPGMWRDGPGGVAACADGLGQPGEDDSSGGAGGGGGGYGQPGATGGGGAGPATGGAGGLEDGTATLSPLRGGCRGGAGAGGGSIGGAAGAAGGALHLAVRSALVVAGTVIASGGPGRGGDGADAGGGGGGSGGAIFLEAESVHVMAAGDVCANGGGGGGGVSSGGTGGAGERGSCSETMGAAGGEQAGGGVGGAGGYRGDGAQQGTDNGEGGGGGGGGVGRIRIRGASAPTFDGTVTPMATTS